jgi:hypothetical protein
MKLEDINKENPFSVPDGYFDNFYDRLQNKLVYEEPKKEIKLNFNLSRILNPLAKIAAIILLMLLLTNIDEKESIYLVESNDDYVSNMLYEMDDLSFAEAYYSEEEELNSDDLEDYVLNNMTDYEIINNLY